MGQILISATNKSSGKTVVTTGICAALRSLNYIVQPFKKGPDYIDPMWLSTAAQRNCYNLDFWTQSEQEILQLFHSKSADTDIAIIEANKGLHDGLNLDGSNSNAALAKLLNTSVIMVIDCRGTTRGIAPLLLGYQQFDSEVNIQGVILNFVAGSRHESKLRQVVEHYTDLRIVGAIHRGESLELEERYLGLMPSNEDQLALKKIDSLREAIGRQVDLNAIMQIASPISVKKAGNQTSHKQFNLTIAYARDEAFGFYYADDLETFSKLGAKLVPFDTLKDKQLPNADALFIGGGFPEQRMELLEHNSSLRTNILEALDSDLPAYAECGGLMYLTKTIKYNSQSADMVGFIDADCVMTKIPQGRGYTQFLENDNSPWKGNSDKVLNAHEFHYSYLDGLNEHSEFCFKILRGQGISSQKDGLRQRNTLACYTHQRHTEQNQWIGRFLEFVETCKLNSA